MYNKNLQACLEQFPGQKWKYSIWYILITCLNSRNILSFCDRPFSLHLIKGKFGPNFEIMTKNWIKGKIQKSELFMSFLEMVLNMATVNERNQFWLVLNGASGPIQNLQSGDCKLASWFCLPLRGSFLKKVKFTWTSFCLSKTCLENLCKYEAIQTSQAALRVHMFSNFNNHCPPPNFRKIW